MVTTIQNGYFLRYQFKAVALPLVALDRAAPVPLYRQIRDRVARLVDDGALLAGTRLPASRTLAATLAVHRTTVVRSYRELRALGYLESRPGSYTTIRRRFRAPGFRPGLQRPAPENPHPADQPSDVIDFARHAPDPTLAPFDDLRRAAKQVLAEPNRRRLAEYPDPRGLVDLREAIAARMAGHGVGVTPDEILVTNGAQHGLDLALRLRRRPGSQIVTEAPTYGLALELMRLHGCRPIGVPMDQGGMDLESLERVARHRSPSLLYTMPSFHNPTGITTTQQHREALLAICEARRILVIEDGFDEELKYSGEAVFPMKAIDAHGTVLYLGTLSKLAFPGLRVGWIAGSTTLIDRLAAIQRVTSLGCSSLAQAIAARFCSGSRFEGYVRRVHRVYRRRMQALLDGLAEELPSRFHWTRPRGGYTLWLSLPGDRRREPELVDRIRRAGVLVSAGSEFFPRRSQIPHFRLSISCVAEDRIADGCRRLARALR